MTRRLRHAILCIPGVIGLTYGTFTMLFHSITVRATAKCCTDTNVCGSNQFCMHPDNLADCSASDSNYCMTIAN